MFETTFTSHGTACGAWHFVGAGDAFLGDAGRPCIVMAHGFGATRDCGLRGFGERLSAAGLDVLAFDYRTFGTSDGSPRNLVDMAGQRADYHAAIAHARRLDGVDPDRIVLWGVSLAGGHVFQVAADAGDVAAVIALTPAPDGRASMLNLARASTPSAMRNVVSAALLDVVASGRGRKPRTLPITGPHGSTAILATPNAYENYMRIAGPSWVNETPARVALKAGLDRPGRHARRVDCPVLVQVADHDQTAPPAAARTAAWDSRAEVRNYPCDHFDVYPGEAWFKPVVDHQLVFLRRHLSA